MVMMVILRRMPFKKALKKRRIKVVLRLIRAVMTPPAVSIQSDRGATMPQHRGEEDLESS